MTEKILSPTDEKIIVAVHRYNYLTREQIARLLRLNVTHTNVVLQKLIGIEKLDGKKKLTGKEYLTTANQPAKSFKLFYMVGKEGVKYLWRVHEINAKVLNKHISYEFQVPHLLQVNETMIMIEQFATSSPAITLVDLIHDYTLKEDKHSSHADTWAHLQLGNRDLRLWIECDRATEKDEKKFKEKIERMLTCISREWNRGRPTYILFMIFEDAKRLNIVYKWIEETLYTLNVKGQTFRLAYFENGALNYNEVFFEPIWYQPFEKGQKPLLVFPTSAT